MVHVRDREVEGENRDADESYMTVDRPANAHVGCVTVSVDVAAVKPLVLDVHDIVLDAPGQLSHTNALAVYVPAMSGRMTVVA